MSSSSSAKATEQVAGKKNPPQPRTLFLPFVILMVVLIISAARETSTLHLQKTEILQENVRSSDILSRSAQQTDALHDLQDDLQKLATSDPVAAKITAEYFPPASSPNQNSNTP